ncbi:MAG: hypothetical protein K5870_11630, partial [Lachnospiraceae bacterium]|nr:hypothetical protein [Lachnospiraceae bacterium]
MELDYFAFYTEASLVCVAILIMLMKRRFGQIVMTPALASIGVIIVAYIIKPLFWISKDGILNNLYYPFMVT